MISLRQFALMTSAAASLSFGAVHSASALDLSNLSQAERDAFRDEIRAYLLESPEILLEAYGVLEQRQANQQAALDKDLVRVNAEALFHDGYSHVAGNLNGDITIVEFVDYQCGYCRKAYDAVQDLLAKDQSIKLILKEFPILSEASMLSSRFAISAQTIFGEDAYASLHDALISLRGPVTRERLISLGDELGLDGETIAKGMNATQVDAILAQNRSLGQRLQITGTPAFVMHDDMARGYMPLETMEQIIRSIREKRS